MQIGGDIVILVNKLYNGEALNETELHFLATGFSLSKMENMIDEEDMGAIKFVDEQDGDSGRWTKHKTTIFKVNNDLWCVEWEEGLTECQENEFYDQPYKVKCIEDVVIVKKYVPIN